MSEFDIDFDWSPLGEKFWRSAAESCAHKPSEQQIRFACCRHSHGLNASDSAAKAGYEGDADAIRVAGHRASKSTAVMELLSYAVAETGKGDEGLVSGKEARRILSRIARRGNNNEKIKSLEALARLDQSEREAKQTGEPDYAEELYLLARSIPRDSVGAMLGLAHYFGAAGHIIGHPFLKEVAPIAAKRFTADWQHYRSKHDPDEIALLDKLAAGPLLDGDELVAAIAAKTPRVATVQVGAIDA